MTNSRPVAGFLIVLEPVALSSKIPFYYGQNLIGRSETKATLVIKEPSISQKHAKLIATPNKITIIDLRSKNGVKINNEGNYIEPQNQVVIDNSMIIYFADAKCRIEIIETNQETRNLQSITLKVENKRKQNIDEKIQKMETRIQQKKSEINQFEIILQPCEYDLEEGFEENKKREQKLKAEKQQKKKSKKNTKSKPELNIKINQNQKNNKNIQQQQRNPKVEESYKRNKSEEQKKPVVNKKSPKKGSKEKQEKRKSPQIQQKNFRFQEQTKLDKQVKEPQKEKNKNQDQQKEKLVKENTQLPKIKKAQIDEAAKKKQTKNSKEKKQSKSLQQKQKVNNKQMKISKEKPDLNETLRQKQLNKKRKNTEQTSLDNSADTTKKKDKQGKKMPSESLQREFRQSARRNTVGKRVLFSGFLPKMRRKYFVLVEDYNEEFDYLVMKQYIRTFKALLAISKGILIVKNSWIQESQQSLRTLNVTNYLFRKIQPIYQAIDRVKSGFKVFKGYQFYLLSTQYHLKVFQIQTLIRNGGGQAKTIKGQVKIKDPHKCVAILRNKHQNTFTSELKDEIGKGKKFGFELIYQIEFLLDACEKQQINWQNSRL